MTCTFPFALGLILFASSPDAADDVLQAFDKMADFELYSLDPDKETKEGFHGYAILGNITLKGDAATKVRDSVKKGLGENNDRKGACFRPRHGIRFVSEKKTYDLLICFQCLQIYFFEGEKEIGWRLTGNSPGPFLNKVLVDAKVPLPEK